MKIAVPPEEKDDSDINGLFVTFSCKVEKEDWPVAKEG